MLSPSVARRSTAPLLTTLLLLNAATVSTLYWAQSIAVFVRSDVGPSLYVGLMPSAALIGYAAGVAISAAFVRDLAAATGLGLHALVLGLGLSAAALAPSAPGIMLACLFVGLGCSLTQRILAIATSTVSSQHRGPVIGGVIASGLTGIVVARAAIPAASLAVGWRTMMSLAAALVCSAGLAAVIAAQRAARHSWPSQPGALPSVWQLWRQDAGLRRAATHQACVFAAFNGGWAVFPRVLAHIGVETAVPIGVVASLGAVAALAAGWLCRWEKPADVAQAGAGAVLLAVGGSLVAPGSLPVACGLMALLDIGTQTALVANQARAQAQVTSPAMRGRVAAIVTTAGFAAGAVGAAIGNVLL